MGAPRNQPDPSAADTVLQGFLGYRMRRAWLAVQADLTETLKPFDLRMITFSALVLVEANPRLSQAQLARLMAVERPNLVMIVDELERRGLIARNRAPEDRRAYALDVTDAGRDLCRDAVRAVRAHEGRIFRGLDECERRAVEAAFATVRRNATAS
jgi:DNA-binding MarR family transcriptional regulator